MDVPPGFTVSLPGGVTVVSCDTCGESRSATYHVEIERARTWAVEHRCEAPAG